MAFTPSNHPSFAPLKHSSHATKSGSSVACWYSAPDEHPPEKPVLVMIHGWPQSSFLFRHIIPPLAAKYPVFLADLPGYGLSTPSNKGGDRLTVGTSILEAFTAAMPKHKNIIFLSHDRGARTAQRLAVNRADFPNLSILAAILIDIVPYVEQWAGGKAPRIATAYFHWAFLATPLALPMITAYGGARFCSEILHRTCGKGEEGRRRFMSDDAIEHYAAYFDRESNNQAAVEDYTAGATVDWDQQIEDQKAGRKIDVPVLVLYSEANLGKMHDVSACWKDWVAPGTKIECIGIGDGAGHYIPEEASEQTVELSLKFLRENNF